MHRWYFKKLGFKVLKIGIEVNINSMTSKQSADNPKIFRLMGDGLSGGAYKISLSFSYFFPKSHPIS